MTVLAVCCAMWFDYAAKLNINFIFSICFGWSKHWFVLNSSVYHIIKLVTSFAGKSLKYHIQILWYF